MSVWIGVVELMNDFHPAGQALQNSKLNGKGGGAYGGGGGKLSLTRRVRFGRRGRASHSSYIGPYAEAHVSLYYWISVLTFSSFWLSIHSREKSKPNRDVVGEGGRAQHTQANTHTCPWMYAGEHTHMSMDVCRLLK